MEVALTVNNLRSKIEEWKKPYLQEVTRTALDFKSKVQRFKQEMNQSSASSEEDTPLQSTTRTPAKKNTATNSQKQGKRINTIESKVCDPEVKHSEWKPSLQAGFKDYEDIVKSYNNVFKKKQRVKNRKIGDDLEDFRADQRNMLMEIFADLKNQDSDTVEFDSIVEFFEHCDLFYHYYNIQPYRLGDLLKQCAHQHETRLTKSEFFDFFLIDRPVLSEWMPKTFKANESKCILPDEAWKSLRAIFDTLDTFGNEKICMKSMLQKIKNSPNCVSLLSSPAVEYPTIDRQYTLEKIFFDIDNKMKFEQKVDWNTVEDLIRGYSPLSEPTIDIIFSQNISAGKITKSSNYFLLEEKIIKLLKQIFKRCPKYAGSFVKTSFFSYQLLESGLLKPHFSVAARPDNPTKNTYLSLETVIKRLTKDAPSYLDIDEMLQFFSIKGLDKGKIFGSLNYEFEEISSSSEEETAETKEERRLKKVRSLQQLKKMRRKDKKKKKVFEGTKAVQFNLHKKTEPTIRERKVQEMIQQKQAEMNRELNKKFKANPIPVSLNPERYQKYAVIMQKKKQSILNRLNLKREADNMVIEYLKSNTKLFEVKKNRPHCQDIKTPYSFEPTPMPFSFTEDMLEKIEADKKQRRKILNQETNKKYMLAWKDLLEKQMQEKQGEEDSILEELKRNEQKNKFKQFKSKEVPNFKQLQKKFEQELEHRKRKIKTTSIKEFNLSSPKQKDIKQSFLSPQPKKFTSSYSRSKSPPQATYPIKSTKKYDDWVAHNQTKVAEREIQKLQKERQKEERLLKQKNFAKFMRKSLANCTDNTKLLKMKTEQKLRNYRDYVNQLEKQTEQQLAQIYVRALQRPFLFEENSSSNAPTIKRDKPKKIVSDKRKQEQPAINDYPPQGVFSSDGDDFHPMESENLNQSY